MALSKKNMTVAAVGVILALASGMAGGYASLVSGVGMVVAGIGVGGIVAGNVKGK